MTNEQMHLLLKEILERLELIYATEKHWAQRWKKGEKGMILHPPTNPDAVDGLERRLGKVLPPSYRQFLGITDGCDHFWEDFSFLGTSGEHSARVLADIDERLEWQKGRIKEKCGALTEATIIQWEAENSRKMYLPKHIPIGTTFAGDLYVFDTRTKEPNGEMGVVYWDVSWGAWDDRRDRNFYALLERSLREVDERSSQLKTKVAKKTSGKKDSAKEASVKKAGGRKTK